MSLGKKCAAELELYVPAARAPRVRPDDGAQKMTSSLTVGAERRAYGEFAPGAAIFT